MRLCALIAAVGDIKKQTNIKELGALKSCTCSLNGEQVYRSHDESGGLAEVSWGELMSDVGWVAGGVVNAGGGG